MRLQQVAVAFMLESKWLVSIVYAAEINRTGGVVRNRLRAAFSGQVN